ncbi:MAG: chemotaxis response regulator protein-glutamate methylesterase [Pseudomonadota bacterium]
MTAMPSTQAPSTSTASASGPTCRALIVDDSAVLRRILTKTLESDPEIEVVQAVGDGQEAIDAVSKEDIDVVVLDVEMPKMDGLTALPKILEASPGVQVLMASKLTLKGAEISVNALSAGAADYLAKPSADGSGMSLTEFNREIRSKVKALGGSARSMKRRKGVGAAGRPSSPIASKDPAGAGAARPSAASSSDFTLRSPPLVFRPKILAIGSSTGGPQALIQLLTEIARYTIDVPIVITQHMPPMFTKILAQQISTKCGLEASEAEDGSVLKAGSCYVAPGGKHMLINENAGQFSVSLSDGPPVHFCKPAVDPMLNSLVTAVGGKHILTAILTGMGADGRDGGRVVVDQGGVLLAQDEETSVVWGMPGAVATAGLCHAVLPIEKIGGEIAKFARWSPGRQPMRSTA